MKRINSTSAYDAPESMAPVPKDKVLISKAPADANKVAWQADPSLVATRPEEDLKRKAPEMKFLYLVSGCMTVLVIWGIVREVGYRFPLMLYGGGGVESVVVEQKMAEQITATNVAKFKFENDPITSRVGRQDSRRFLQKFPYSLGAHIGDWDKQREDYIANPDSPADASGFFLVSGQQPQSCAKSIGDHYFLKFLKNRVDYCRLHGIKNHLYNMADIDESVNRLWVKLPLLRTLMLQHPGVEWFMWMDSDSLITDMNHKISLERYAEFNFVIHGNPDLVYDKKQWSGLSTGVFLIRNCQWSLDFLEAWARMSDKVFEEKWGVFLSDHLTERPRKQPAEDQSAAVYLLASEPPKWGSKVYMEKASDLSLYWKDVVDKYEGMGEKPKQNRWPFVTHFAGCEPCIGVGKNATISSCQSGMERAFNFADNQVLARYGFTHTDLSSYTVKPVGSSAEKKQ